MFDVIESNQSELFGPHSTRACTAAVCRISRLQVSDRSGLLPWKSFPRQWSILLRSLEKHAPNLDKLGVYHVCHAFACMRPTPVLPPSLSSKLVDAVLEHSAQLKPAHFSAVMWSLARLNVPPTPALTASLRASLANVASRLTAFGIANVMWACGRMNIQIDVSLQAHLEQCLLQQGTALTGGCASSVFWSYATLALVPQPQTMEFLERTIQRTIEIDMPTSAVPNILWAYARMCRAPPPPILDALYKVLQTSIPHFDISNLCNTVLSLAVGYNNVQLPHTALLVTAVYHRLGETLDNMDRSHAGRTLWALGKLNEIYPVPIQLTQKAEGAVLRALRGSRTIDSRYVTNLVWAMGALRSSVHGRLVPPLRSELATILFEEMDLALRDGSAWSNQAINSVLWSLARLWPHILSILPCDVLPALEAQFRLPRPSLSELVLSNTFWAFATLRHMPSQATAASLEDSVLTCIDGLSVSAVANILWSLAVLGWTPTKDLLLKIVDKLTSETVSPQDGSLTLWSLSVMDLLHEFREPVVRLWSIVLNDTSAMGLSKLSHLQLHLVWCVALHPPPGVPPLDLQWTQSNPVVVADKLSITTTSSLHSAVSDILNRLNVAHVCEARAGPFIGDIILSSPTSGRGVVIEVDGPFHFLTNSGETPTGSTLFKRRLLGRMGWTVVPVPYFEWNAAASQVEYLLGKLKGVGVTPQP
eukprot:c5319_g1_i2.p1 GENE.c5319_g1_i2~~c5319_g1_i2.p1  ORF type:complete len:774 (+),score=112.41 c5319_g1_i2:216-2324(+)